MLFAVPVCYQWSGPFGNERFVLDINRHSRLVPNNAGNQTAFSVHGKHVGVCGFETMADVTGTVTTAGVYPFQAQGSHLGLRTHSVRATAGGQTFCKEVTLDCTTPEIISQLQPNLLPKNWTCFSRNEWDNVHGGITSSLSLISFDGFCKLYQDTGSKGGIPFVPTQDPCSQAKFSGCP